MEIKQRRGISLVALIITIIVLIILTGAVIMSITGENNTMEKASEAVFKNDMTTYREELSTNVMQRQLNANGAYDKSQVDATGDGLKQYIPSITEGYKEKLKIEDAKLYYIDITNEQEFGWAAELNMADLSTVAAGTVQVGQYIKYTPGEGTYTAKKEQTGYGSQEYIEWGYEAPATTDQTYTSVASAEDWRVLSVKGAEVTIVREEVLPALTLFGQIGYDNAVQELNNICSIYKDNKYAKEARSITVEDVNGVTGYSSSDMAAYGGGSSSEGGYGYKYTHNGIEYTQDYYEYTGTSKIENTTEEYKMLFKNKANSSNLYYWVASRCVNIYFSNVGFYVRFVDGGNVYAYYFYDSDGYEGCSALGVRPVVVLKSNVRVNGSGTSTEPYTIAEN